MNKETHSLAITLINSVTEALRNGTKHYSLDGKELATVLEVIEHLQKDGSITIKPTKG